MMILASRWGRRVGKGCSLQLKVVQTRQARLGKVRHLQLEVVQMSDPDEFSSPILCIDRDEQSLPGFRRRGSRTARTRFVCAGGS